MITLICQQCGKEFQAKPSWAKRAKYCSKACFHEARRKRKTYTCAFCGEQFERHPSREKYGRAKHCSPECQYAAIKSRESKAKVQCTCLNCGKTFYRLRSWLKRKGGGKYCSRKCRDEHWKGEHNPLYIDGNGVNWHGPNWQSQRRKALKRDNFFCRDCGRNNEESLKDFGQPLTVHHIKPFRLFNDDYKKANRLTNLITLCHSCHRTAEADLYKTEV